MKSRKLIDNAEPLESLSAAIASKLQIRSNIRCYKCNKKGHIAKDCRSKPNPKNNSTEKEVKVRAALAGNANDCKHTFIMDSGCTQHITKDLSNCESLHDIDPIKVHLANDNIVEAKKEGVVRMVMEPRKGGIQTQLLLNKVLYVPDAGVNMISCTQLDKSDISTIIEGSE